MFRRLTSSLPEDPKFPADLLELGYHVNEQDRIRSNADPMQEFHYFISKNDRVLEVQREAMDSTCAFYSLFSSYMRVESLTNAKACIRNIVTSRLESADLTTIRLPLTAAQNDPHIPILTSHNIDTASRILVYFGEVDQDLGIFAYRAASQESISAGSCLTFVHEARQGPRGQDTAVLIANLGQLVWYRAGQRAMTPRTWQALPRDTGVSPPMQLDPLKNRVESHATPSAHVASVFEYIHDGLLRNRQDVKIDIIGVSDGAEESMKYLHENWNRWKDHMGAMAVGLGYPYIGSDGPRDLASGEFANEEFANFWDKRARAYLVHEDPLDTTLDYRDQMLCDCVSSGADKYTECIMPAAYKSMLAFFNTFDKQQTK